MIDESQGMLIVQGLLFIVYIIARFYLASRVDCEDETYVGSRDMVCRKSRDSPSLLAPQVDLFKHD